MSAEKITAFLNAYDLTPSHIKLAYVDLTEGETTESYVAIGLQKDFNSIYEFAAHGLIAIDQHKTGAQLEPYPTGYWIAPEVHPCEPESWMTRYDATLDPRNHPSFANFQKQGLELPPKLEKQFYLVPHLRATEDCVVCQGTEVYVLLYWHTTG